MTQRENEASVVEMERDSLGRVVRETVNGRSVQSAYDASGDRTEMTSSLGARVVMSRDALGQPREMYFGAVDGFKEADVRFDRDGLGLESRRAFKNGIEVEWSRDVAGRPTARRTFKRSLAAAAMGFAVGMLATPTFAQPQREEVDARVYQWRGEDQIAGIVDAASGPKFYDHDGRGRLVRERRPDAVVERAMDAVGNVYRSRTGTDRRYGPGGRLEMADGIRYEHDEDGNQTLKSGPDGDWHYRWNGHGMLREVERPDGVRVAFDYDPFARRTAKRTLSAAGTVDQEVQFVWDGHNVIHELDSDRGLISWQWEPESFTPIAKEHNGRRWTIASDHLGTPTEMYDEVGQLAWKMQLDVFGVPRFEAGRAEDCPWRWPGQYEDGATGLFYNNFRYYHPPAAQYTSRDPLGVSAGLRLWSYPGDSLSSADPLGLIPAPASLPDVPGIYIIRNGTTSYVGSAGLGAGGMNTRVSSISHANAQALLSMPGTEVRFVRVDLGTAVTGSDRNNILRFFEQEQLDREVREGFTMLNSPRAPPQAASARAHALSLISTHGASRSRNRVRCR